MFFNNHKGLSIEMEKEKLENLEIKQNNKIILLSKVKYLKKFKRIEVIDKGDNPKSKELKIEIQFKRN